MDLNLITVFEAVARSRSFSAAAKELRPKSSVSRGVARLEAELGAQLLFRTTRQVSLTAAGTALYDRMAPLLRSVQAALGEVPEREEEPLGRAPRHGAGGSRRALPRRGGQPLHRPLPRPCRWTCT